MYGKGFGPLSCNFIAAIPFHNACKKVGFTVSFNDVVSIKRHCILTGWLSVLQVGLKYKLPILSPVDDAGVFTEEAGQFQGLQVRASDGRPYVHHLLLACRQGQPGKAFLMSAVHCAFGSALRLVRQTSRQSLSAWREVFLVDVGDLQGMLTLSACPMTQVQEGGNKAVIEALQQAGALLKQERYQHKYPYDWRTKKPTIFRATDQVGRVPGVISVFWQVSCWCTCALRHLLQPTAIVDGVELISHGCRHLHWPA